MIIMSSRIVGSAPDIPSLFIISMESLDWVVSVPSSGDQESFCEKPLSLFLAYIQRIGVKNDALSDLEAWLTF